MKKLLVLLVVLGFVSAASAGIIDIKITSLNGQPIVPPVSEITITPSDIVDLTIVWTAGDTGRYLFSLTSFVNVNGLGTLDLTATARNAAMDSTLEKKGTATVSSG